MSTEGFRPFKYAEKYKTYFISDKLAGHIHAPYQKFDIEWQEHPDGEIQIYTNNMGFRQNNDVYKNENKGVYRILITGDSQIEGVVNNNESVSYILDSLLNNKSSQRYEIINGATGHYDFYNYVGLINKYYFLQPDLYMVIINEGNDYLESLITAGKRNIIKLPSRTISYRTRLKCALFVNPGAVWQCLNQIYFYKHYPQMINSSENIMANCLLEMKSFCDLKSIQLLVVVLPTKCKIEWGRDANRLN